MTVYSTRTALSNANNSIVEDNISKSVTPADMRQALLNVFDTASTGAQTGFVESTQKINYTPPAAAGGKWRVVKDVDFQGGLTMTSQDYVKFVNCQIGGPSTLTTCDNIRFEECYFDGHTGAAPAITLSGCTNIVLSQCGFENIEDEGVKLVSSCEDVTITDCYFNNVCSSAAALSQTPGGRLRPWEYTGQAYVFTDANAGIDARNSAGITIRDCKLNNVGKTGILISECNDSLIDNCKLQDCGDIGATDAYAEDDSGVIIHDSHNVTMRGGYIKSSDGDIGYGILLWGERPDAAYDKRYDGDRQSQIIIDGVLVDMYEPGGWGRFDNANHRGDGIEILGGTHLTIQNCEVRHSGRTGIHLSETGSNFCRLVNNFCHHNGTTTYLGGTDNSSHKDGISFVRGDAPYIAANVCLKNHRHGLQLKTTGFQSDDEGMMAPTLVANTTIGNGFSYTATGGASGYGLNMNNDDGAVTAASNVTILGHTSWGNAAGAQFQRTQDVSIFGANFLEASLSQIMEDHVGDTTAEITADSDPSIVLTGTWTFASGAKGTEGKSITRTTGGDLAGVVSVGDRLRVTRAENPTNDGLYVVASVIGNQVTLDDSVGGSNVTLRASHNVQFWGCFIAASRTENAPGLLLTEDTGLGGGTQSCTGVEFFGSRIDTDYAWLNLLALRHAYYTYSGNPETAVLADALTETGRELYYETAPNSGVYNSRDNIPSDFEGEWGIDVADASELSIAWSHIRIDEGHEIYLRDTARLRPPSQIIVDAGAGWTGAAWATTDNIYAGNGWSPVYQVKDDTKVVGTNLLENILKTGDAVVNTSGVQHETFLWVSDSDGSAVPAVESTTV